MKTKTPGAVPASTFRNSGGASLPFFSGEDAGVQDFQQAAVIMGRGSVRECLFGRQAGIRQKEA